MLITKRNEFALQSSILLAKSPRKLSSSDLARSLGTSPAFMSKIAQQLVRAGIFRSVRGKRGGLSLARPPRDILVKEIFRAADGPLLISNCLATGPCGHLSCPLFPILGKIQAELDRKLNNARLSDLAKGGTS